MRRCLGRARLVYTLPVRRFLDWVTGLAEMLGGPGLFLIAFLDSSFLSFPQVVDILLMGLVAKYPERLLYYASLPAVGSVLGCFTLYTLARRGGEAFLRRRLHDRHVDRYLAIFRKYGLFAIAIPSILPPPVPFKVFVVAAGAAGVRRVDFLIAVAIGRGIRYFGEAALAAWYGAAAIDFLQENAGVFTVGLVTLIAAAAGAWFWWSRRRGQIDSASGTSV
jgi:membrane protein YqaA with SNARE-associated domain